ncbi:MAG: tryptophan-rich sensory protein [Acholeplasmataceae bacterium]|nr:tryptophan-rich sensory protein [Acholeplasmataceae bacterium]
MLITKIIFVIGFVFMLTLNILANALPLNNRTTGQISDQYGNLFTPSGATFSIWGVIYVLLSFVVIYLLFKPNSFFENQVHLNIIWLLTALSFFNGIWIVLWHFDKIFLSVIVMILMLITLGFLFTLTPASETLIKITVSIYFGWISVAMIANVTVLLTKYSFNGFGIKPIYWLLLVLLIGVILSILVLLSTRNTIFVFVIIWAYLGILMRHISVSEWNKAYPLAIYSLIGFLVILVNATLFTFFKNDFKLYI